MSTRKTVPEAVANCLQPPYSGSLVLTTYVLGASNNWLLLRYLKACFDRKNAVRQQDADGDAVISRHDVESAEISVMFVSWMRNFDFWRAEAKKAVVRQNRNSVRMNMSLICSEGSRSSQAAAAGPLCLHRWHGKAACCIEDGQ